MTQTPDAPLMQLVPVELTEAMKDALTYTKGKCADRYAAMLAAAPRAAPTEEHMRAAFEGMVNMPHDFPEGSGRYDLDGTDWGNYNMAWKIFQGAWQAAIASMKGGA